MVVAVVVLVVLVDEEVVDDVELVREVVGLVELVLGVLVVVVLLVVELVLGTELVVNVDVEAARVLDETVVVIGKDVDDSVVDDVGRNADEVATVGVGVLVPRVPRVELEPVLGAAGER